ncbi:MAG: hypothetical protein U1E36_09795 [Rickettsiales bacterium]
MKQLALQLGASGTSFRAEDYLITAANRQAYHTVMQSEWPAFYALLSGPAGSGKTHLAMAWATANHAHYTQASILHDAFVSTWQAQPEPLVIDRLETLNEEKLLFHMLNLAKETGTPVLVSGQSTALQRIMLPDLKSRLAAAPQAIVEEPDDELMRGLFIKHFSDKQLQISPDILQYLVNHVERSGTAVDQCVHVIDQQALEKKQKISIAFLRKYLQHGKGSVNGFVNKPD